jgi:hypothetical protein
MADLRRSKSISTPISLVPMLKSEFLQGSHLYEPTSEAWCIGQHAGSEQADEQVIVRLGKCRLRSTLSSASISIGLTEEVLLWNV